MKQLLPFIIMTFLFISCSSDNTECGACGGGLIDGYMYKTVTLDDLTELADINVTSDVGACIRVQLDESGFTEATIVDDCCCTEYE